MEKRSTDNRESIGSTPIVPINSSSNKLTNRRE